MKYSEEGYAKELSQDLSLQLGEISSVAEVMVEGAGVHWDCIVKMNNELCKTSCFSTFGAEYLTLFERNSEILAWGRTSAKNETINAVKDWIEGEHLATLYARYSFVDESKRALIDICEQAKLLVPRLAESADIELKHIMCDIHELWFRIDGRSCKISFYGKNKFPDAAFHWDDCELFRFNADDTKLLAKIMNRWLCDSAMPSAMRVDFPRITIGKLADFYESGNPVEGEFIESWNFIERFYSDLNFSFTPKVLNLIAAMRKEGYDRLLRAGQSLSTLILSRARRHGLRNDQPNVAFQFQDSGMFIHDNASNNKSLLLPEIEFTSEVDSILKELVALNID